MIKKSLALIALILTAAAPAAARETPAYRLYCAVDSKIAYFATFDSGDQDEVACKLTAKFWDMYYDSQHVTDHACWCSRSISA